MLLHITSNMWRSCMNSSGQKQRILVADDVESIVKLMEHILTKNGFEVASACDGEEALSKMQIFKPDLVILDIMMPKLHGIDVLKKIKAVEKAPGVIICSSKSYKPDIDQAKTLGAFDVIQKPFDHDEFLVKVTRFFKGASSAAGAQAAAPEPLPAGEAYLPSIDTSRPVLTLYGTRGSVPVSGRKYIHHGGNTSCISLQKGGETIIIDAGSGIRDLGMTLAAQKPCRLNLFISHTHWDHIQGFPFFVPAYIPGYEIAIHGASGFGKDLKSIFSGQLDRDYFPVQLEDMNAKLDFQHLADNPVVIGDFEVFWEFTHHPGPTLGYKIRVGGKTIAYLSDNEFLKGYLGHPSLLEPRGELLNAYSKIVEFVSGVDILVAEAQYTNAEYAKKIGWGHSSLSNACLLAKLAGVKKWIVIHHDPMHDDDFVQNKLNLTRRILDELDYPIPVVNGFDGYVEYL